MTAEKSKLGWTETLGTCNHQTRNMSCGEGDAGRVLNHCQVLPWVERFLERAIKQRLAIPQTLLTSFCY